jgi:hypothetical protein
VVNFDLYALTIYLLPFASFFFLKKFVILNISTVSDVGHQEAWQIGSHYTI